MTGLEPLKREAARRAVELVRSGTVVGLGTGSTARYAVEALAERLADGSLRDVRGVPTSRATEALARDAGVPLVELPAEGVDLAIDGMDEVTPSLDAIKGLGGALTREKIVAAAARRFVLIGDDSKRVARLGERAPLPVEVLPFGRLRTAQTLRELGLAPCLRGGHAEPFVTDNGNQVLDCALPGNAEPAALAAALARVPGVVAHGFFLGMASLAFVAGEGGVEVLERPAPEPR